MVEGVERVEMAWGRLGELGLREELDWTDEGGRVIDFEEEIRGMRERIGRVKKDFEEGV